MRDFESELSYVTSSQNGTDFFKRELVSEGPRDGQERRAAACMRVGGVARGAIPDSGVFAIDTA